MKPQSKHSFLAHIYEIMKEEILMTKQKHKT